MLQHLVVTMAFMTVLSCLWLVVQRLWQRHVPEQGFAGGDALSNRSGCHGCSCDQAVCEEPGVNTNTTTEVDSNAPARL